MVDSVLEDLVDRQLVRRIAQAGPWASSSAIWRASGSTSGPVTQWFTKPMRLSARLSERQACKAIVGLLVLAADGHEAQLASELEQLIELDQLPDLLALMALLAPLPGVLPSVTVVLPIWRALTLCWGCRHERDH